MKNVIIVSNTVYGIEMFLMESIKLLAESKNVTIVTNTDNDRYFEKINCKTRCVSFTRKPSVLTDLKNTWLLAKILRQEKAHLVLSFTPKSGLVAGLAGLVTRKRTCHTFTGQVWATKTGFVRIALMALDRLIMFLNYRSYCDSYSQAKFLKAAYSFNIPKIFVIGNGSLGGVDLNNFRLEDLVKDRFSYNLLFLARKTRDKGAFDALRAFSLAAEKSPQLRLYYIGPEEETLPRDCKRILLQYSDRIVNVNGIVEAKDYLRKSDILLLPSRREGFGSIVIQAAAMGIPTIGYKIYGLTCSVGRKSGLLVPVGNIDNLADGILKLVERLEKESQEIRLACRKWSERFDSVNYAIEWNKEIDLLLQ